MNDFAIQVTGLSKAFSQAQEDLIVLDQVSFNVPVGQHVAITGPSGSGKSTLIHALGLLESCQAQTFNLLGQDVRHLSAQSQAQFRKQYLVCYQAHHFLVN